MAPLVKPAIVPKIDGEASFLQKSFVFHLLYTLVENSHISCLLGSISLHVSDLIGAYKNHVRQNGK